MLELERLPRRCDLPEELEGLEEESPAKEVKNKGKKTAGVAQVGLEVRVQTQESNCKNLIRLLRSPKG